jgi:hypothetical protein
MKLFCKFVTIYRPENGGFPNILNDLCMHKNNSGLAFQKLAIIFLSSEFSKSIKVVFIRLAPFGSSPGAMTDMRVETAVSVALTASWGRFDKSVSAVHW